MSSLGDEQRSGLGVVEGEAGGEGGREGGRSEVAEGRDTMGSCTSNMLEVRTWENMGI